MRDHLANLIDDFRRCPREIAVVQYQGNRRRQSTYGYIAALATRFAALLEDRGIVAGDRVLLWAENSAEWMASFHGCMLRGVIVVPLDVFGTADFAARIVADVQPSLAVGDLRLLQQLPIANKLAFEEWDAVLPLRQATAIPNLNRDTLLQILFTSGTTGEPKGIVHTHGNVLASISPIEEAAQSYLRYEKYVHPLRFLHTLPLSHVFGQTMGLWIPPIFRAEVHFENRLVAPRLIETIKRERISLLAAVPRVFALIKSHLESNIPGLSNQIAQSHNIRAWKKWWRFRAIHRQFGFKFWALISGGGALSANVERFWNALGFVLVQGYGMTETTALITLNHPFHVAHGTIGKPLPGREVKIGSDGEVLVRGPMISSATWQGGELRRSTDEWLPTGDLAEMQPTGELRFLGRKSEVIVTASGLNIHPEDLEAAVEAQTDVAACAVVPVVTPSGTEPCAVLAMRSSVAQPADVIEKANLQLADFQRFRRWLLWPEPDMPRTSTGKIRRRTVAEWAACQQGRNSNAEAAHDGWLLRLITQITGEVPASDRDELRLDEDLHLDSLARVQLSAALEEKLGALPGSGLFERASTLGELRCLTSSPGAALHEASTRSPESVNASSASAVHRDLAAQPAAQPERSTFLYPRWPWAWPVRLIRSIFLECAVRPLVSLLADPKIDWTAKLDAQAEPMLIVANHVTAYDGPLIQYALPGPMRRSVAAAMAGEMLEDLRHFRRPKHSAGEPRFSPLGPLAWLLLTALFNVFPLPRSRDFQRSFAHAGAALDHGFHVLVFPEGTRSATGHLAPFRLGIGMLVKQSNVPVLPVAIRGLGELKIKGTGWFRSGNIELHVGEPMRFSATSSEAEIASALHDQVHNLLHH